MAVAVVDPREHFWTYDDLKELPDDGRRWEIIGGELFEMTGPSWDHGTVAYRLLMLLAPLVTALGGVIRPAPMDVHLRGGNVVQPDLFAILPGGAARTSRRGVEGPPDLVVEVLSPSNRRHDTLTKRALYGASGVREYWLVDPEARTVEVLTLHGDVLRPHRRFEGDGLLVSPMLPDLALPLAEVFAGIEDDTDVEA